VHLSGAQALISRAANSAPTGLAAGDTPSTAFLGPQELCQGIVNHSLVRLFTARLS
jgi:hypothetical protein